MPPTLADRLRHILDAIHNINQMLKGKSWDEFVADWVARAATERFLEIISEASRRIPEAIKAQETEIPWQRVADLGNILRHAYHATDPEIIWNIAQNDLVPLQAFVERVIHEEDANGS